MHQILTLLRKQHTIIFKPTAPFDFDSTFFKPDHFTSNDHIWKPGVRWQTLRFNTLPLGLKFRNRGSVNSPKLEIVVYLQ